MDVQYYISESSHALRSLDDPRNLCRPRRLCYYLVRSAPWAGRPIRHKTLDASDVSEGGHSDVQGLHDLWQEPEGGTQCQPLASELESHRQAKHPKGESSHRRQGPARQRVHQVHEGGQGSQGLNCSLTLRVFDKTWILSDQLEQDLHDLWVELGPCVLF